MALRAVVAVGDEGGGGSGGVLGAIAAAAVLALIDIRHAFELGRNFKVEFSPWLLNVSSIICLFF